MILVWTDNLFSSVLFIITRARLKTPEGISNGQSCEIPLCNLSLGQMARGQFVLQINFAWQQYNVSLLGAMVKAK